MLVLQRKLNESIVIDGRIIVKLLRVAKGCASIGIEAPREMKIQREELVTRAASGSAAPDPPQRKPRHD